MESKWTVVIASSLIAFILKITGYVVPEKYLEKPSIKSITNYVPIVMLSALVIAQTFSQGQAIVFDARLIGLVVAFILLVIRAPFIVVVLAAAFVSAVFRYLTN